MDPHSSLPAAPEPESPPDARDRGKPLPCHGGVRRILKAGVYSARGIAAACRHEAAFRQEFIVGVPAVGLALWLARTPLEALLLAGVVVLVWVVELLNSGLEALADRITLQDDALIGRAKDMGSAAVMLCLLLAVATWAVVLWPRG